jgi:hypothetical protein
MNPVPQARVAKRSIDGNPNIANYVSFKWKIRSMPAGSYPRPRVLDTLLSR